MKSWQTVLFGVLVGLLAAGTVFLATRPPRGTPIQLLPRPTPTPVVVHLIGAVLAPGVYELPPASRVRDAIAAAGGFSPQADTGRVNQAAFLEDGAQIYIPTLPPELPSFTPPTPAPGTPAPAKPELPLTPQPKASHLIDINTASQAELETLPGIGPALAGRIIEYRQTNGPFQSIEAIQEVSGIGPAKFEALRELITVAPAP